ncbi:hypothetical protein F4677DRAFT_442253 [Hypoxylon crocopeplum]|nr:hypothetical protein F4677DRAFT_442253 [Hypoxylon crocopeplum]
MVGWHTKIASSLAVWHYLLIPVTCSVGFLTQGCQLNWEYVDGEARTYCLDHICNINAYTAVPLDWCIANIDGVLTAQKMGNFRQKCSNCKVTNDQYHFGCDCVDGHGGYVYSEINMNDVLYNWWGWLSCFGSYEKVYLHDYPCKDEPNWMPDSSTPDMTCARGCPEVLLPNKPKPDTPMIANASYSNITDASEALLRFAGQAGPRPMS